MELYGIISDVRTCPKPDVIPYFVWRLNVFLNLWRTPTKQGIDILGKMSFDTIAKNTLPAQIWYQNQVFTPPTYWDMTICV